MPVVVLRNFGRRDVILRPSFFNSWGLIDQRFKRLRRLFLRMQLHRSLTRQRQLALLNLPINIYYVFILVELLNPRILLLRLQIIWLLIYSAMAPAIIIIALWVWLFLNSGALVDAVGCRVHWALLLAFVHKIGLVRYRTLVGLRGVVQDGIRNILEQRRSDKLRALLATLSGLLTPHYHLLLSFLHTWATREQG